MKKFLVIVVALVVVTLIGAGAAMAGVKGTKHDIPYYLTTNYTNTINSMWSGTTVTGVMQLMNGASVTSSTTNTTDWSKAEICVYCHTPHNANITAGLIGNQGPLWNRTAGSDATAYTVYTSATMTYGSSGLPAQAASTITLLCLSCHDGSTAIWSMGNPPNYNPYFAGGSVLNAAVGNVGVTGLIGGNAKIDNAMANDHPISFNYDNAANAANAVLADSVNLGAVITGSTTSNLKLVNGKMECSTCHEVHGGVANTAFLRKDNAGSALCIFCHANK